MVIALSCTQHRKEATVSVESGSITHLTEFLLDLFIHAAHIQSVDHFPVESGGKFRRSKRVLCELPTSKSWPKSKFQQWTKRRYTPWKTSSPQIQGPSSTSLESQPWSFSPPPVASLTIPACSAVCPGLASR